GVRSDDDLATYKILVFDPGNLKEYYLRIETSTAYETWSTYCRNPKLIRPDAGHRELQNKPRCEVFGSQEARIALTVEKIYCAR
ncbi:2126_t:CDS:2, partial [Funneliformis caledonium]